MQRAARAAPHARGRDHAADRAGAARYLAGAHHDQRRPRAGAGRRARHRRRRTRRAGRRVEKLRRRMAAVRQRDLQSGEAPRQCRGARQIPRRRARRHRARQDRRRGLERADRHRPQRRAPDHRPARPAARAHVARHVLSRLAQPRRPGDLAFDVQRPADDRAPPHSAGARQRHPAQHRPRLFQSGERSGRSA